MPCYRADYAVKSEVSFQSGDSIELPHWSEAGCTITLRSPSDAERRLGAELNAIVVGDAENIRAVSDRFRTRLAEALDVVSFATQAVLSIGDCLLVVDWEPHKRERDLLIYRRVEPEKVRKPVLPSPIYETAIRLMGAARQDYVARARRYFRKALLESQHEDRFTQFWLAIETIAVGAKEAGPIAIGCGACGTALFCPGCRKPLERKPMSKDAINALIVRLNPADGERAAAALGRTRNHLLHGGSPENVHEKTGLSILEAAELAGQVARSAIASCMVQKGDRLAAKPTGFTEGMVMLAAHVGITVGENLAQPTDAMLHAAEVEVLYE